jgi:hypothetical protein
MQSLLMLAVALSATIFWFQLIPTWLAFASLGVTRASAGLASNVRYGRIRLDRRSAATDKKRRITPAIDRWTAFAIASEPFTNLRTLRQLARLAQKI